MCFRKGSCELVGVKLTSFFEERGIRQKRAGVWELIGDVPRKIVCRVVLEIAPNCSKIEFGLREKGLSQHGVSDITWARSLASRSALLVLPLRD